MRRFLIDKNYGAYLSSSGFPVNEILRKAALPEDLFERQTPCLTAEEYFRFMRAIDALSPDSGAPVRLAVSEGIETFSPPVFAAYCGRDALVCLKRLARYKPLIGALLYVVAESENEVSVEIRADGTDLEPPEILVGIEFVFIVALIRRAAEKRITPIRATAKRPMNNGAYADYIGVGISVGDKNQLIFSRDDAMTPFVSRNESMWDFFEPELNRRLSMTETDDSCSASVRGALMELIPGGECTIDDVARKLGYSRRSLQRRLSAENTSFQKQLNHTRELLAKTYLASTDMSTEDIAFMLGYQEISSFLRAFVLWTGQTAGGYRKSARSGL